MHTWSEDDHESLANGISFNCLTSVLIVVGDANRGADGMKIALGIAVLMNAVSYFYSDKIALCPAARNR